MKEKQFGCIYLITNRVNDKYYVGQTVKTLHTRWQRHRYAATQYNSPCHLHRAIRTYGSDSFTIDLLAVAANKEQLDQLERLWIITLRSTDPKVGYNMTFGGDGMLATDEVKARMSIARKKRITKPETRLKLSATRKGRRLSEEHKQKIGDANRGQERSIAPGCRANMSSARKGKYPTGVSARTGGANFKAQITKNGKLVHLGCFPTVELASEAYQNALIELYES